MIEKRINWQLALTYSEEARRTDWKPKKLEADYLNHTTLLAFTPTLRIIDMRDWVVQTVGQQYMLSAIFVMDESIRGIMLPHLLRFSFLDMETAMLFKLTWV